jgi:hypothetical protein
MGMILTGFLHQKEAKGLIRKYLLGLIYDVVGDVAGSVANADDLGEEGLMNAANTLLPMDPLAEPDAGAASIFFYKIDTCRFKSSFYNVECCSTWLVCVRLKLAHCYDTDPGFVCEVLLTPVEKPTRSPALFRCDHPSRMRGMADSINSVENRLTSSCIYNNHLYCI